jgi:hypothetical protein
VSAPESRVAKPARQRQPSKTVFNDQCFNFIVILIYGTAPGKSRGRAGVGVIMPVPAPAGKKFSN